MERLFSVYEHVFPNGKKYIGITSTDPKKRWDSGWGYKKNIQPAMYHAIQKYGWNNIEHNILFTHLTLTEAQTKEKELIQLFHTCVLEENSMGYNMTYGGEGSLKYLTEEERREAEIKVRKEWVSEHREDKNATQRRYYQKHREEILAKQQAKRDALRVPFIKQTREEKLRKKREAERRRKERMSPEEKEILKQKKKEYYYKNKDRIRQ